MPGTDNAYGAISAYAHAMRLPGTDAAYAGTRSKGWNRALKLSHQHHGLRRQDQHHHHQHKHLLCHRHRHRHHHRHRH
eukprot:3898984-Rhodomonas_salina.1